MTAPTTPNAELAYGVLDQIDAHPELWDQGMWWCGTSGCFAGWACTLSGETPVIPRYGDPLANGIAVSERAAQLLGFATRDDLDGVTDEAGEDGWLFCSDNTREDLGRMVAEIFGPRPDVAQVVDHGPRPDVAQVVDHGPVKPPYGTPERADWDSDHEFDHVDHTHDVPPNAGSTT